MEKPGQSNKMLGQSVEQLQGLIETAPVIICMSDLTAKIHYVNKKFEEATGYSRGDVLGKRWTDLGTLTAENVKLLLGRITEKLKGSPPSPLELKFKRKDGNWIWVSGVGEVIREQGKAVGFQVIATDITQNKQMNEQLLSSREMFTKAFRCSPNAMMISSLEDGCLLDVNDSFLNATGYRYEEVINHKAQELGLWVKPSLRSSMVRKLLKGEKIRDFEYEFRIKSGEIRVGLLSAEKFDFDGETCILGAVQDITERKRAEDALKESERRYRLLAENASDVIWTVDMNMSPTYISPSITRLLGYSVEEAKSKSMQEVFTPNSFKLALKILAEELETEKTQKRKDSSRSRIVELEFNCKDGSIVPIEVNYSFLRDLAGYPTGIQAVAREIRHRKQAEDELKRGAEKLIRGMGATINAMSKIVEMRDPYTSGHQQRVSNLARAIATEMGLPKEQIEGLRLAGIVHDIGKIKVPAETLSKPGELTELEFGMIKMHPQAGYDILKTIEFSWPVAQIVLQHHERMDGSGYPKGLLGKDIIIEARILAIADVVEAMASHRPHRPALGIAKALEEISNNKDILYDPAVVDACVRLFTAKEFQFD